MLSEEASAEEVVVSAAVVVSGSAETAGSEVSFSSASRLYNDPDSAFSLPASSTAADVGSANSAAFAGTAGSIDTAMVPAISRLIPFLPQPFFFSVLIS